MEKKVALITGASSGIGWETAIELKNKGYIVYGAARRVEKMKDLKNYGINIIELDVTNEQCMCNAVETIKKTEGSIDILVNNAGYGSYGAVEDVPMEEARRQIEVNIFGLARMTQLVVPMMRKNKFGKIVNISSMGGKVSTPFGAWYHATKYEVEGFLDCLRMELKPFGIDVIIFKSDNPIMWEYLEPELEKRIKEFEIDESYVAEVRNALIEFIPKGDVKIEDIAKYMNCSKRTLQRRLKDEDTTFQKQLNHVRELLTKHYLKNSEITTEEIAYLLGYKDLTSFLRAFQIWTGDTITEYKQKDDF
ncbi:MAG: SDR family NAD(P)-dependent oxidoreductase [Sarcina sp.]